MSTERKLRVGVVGVGSMGKNHARVYSELPAAEFTAILDPNAEVAGPLAEQYGAKLAGSLEEFLELIDAATIASPTAFHHATALPMIKAGKHLLIEKPITASTSEAVELVEAAHQAGVILQVGHIERFNPALSALEALLTQPKFIEAHRLSPFPNRSTDIDVVLDVMIHDLEVILHLVRSPLASLDAVGVPILSPRAADIANVRLRFENGCVANITASRVSIEKMRKIRIFQPDTYISLDYQDQSGKIFRKTGFSISQDDVTVEKDEPLKVELASFVDCALAGQEPRVSGKQAAAALELAVRISREINEQNAKDQ